MRVTEPCQVGALPAIHLTSPDGARATVTLFGAHLVSWHSADGAEHLFCSARSALDGSRPIRGGVPVIFPQFNERGPIIRHGFARTASWRLVDSGIDGEDGAFAVLALAPGDLAPERASEWPHGFALRLRLRVAGQALGMTLEVDNTGDAPFDFAAALHTYHRVAAIENVVIEGVQAAPLTVGEALDGIYSGIGGQVVLRDGVGRIDSTQQGFLDAVVWNPGRQASAAMADMAPEEYRQFVCIEPAVIAPLTLAPGASWRGHNKLVASSIP